MTDNEKIRTIISQDIKTAKQGVENLNCYNCNFSEILEHSNHFPKQGYSIFGYCHKNGGNYPIFIPEGKCKDHNAKTPDSKHSKD